MASGIESPEDSVFDSTLFSSERHPDETMMRVRSIAVDFLPRYTVGGGRSLEGIISPKNQFFRLINPGKDAPRMVITARIVEKPGIHASCGSLDSKFGGDSVDVIRERY